MKISTCRSLPKLCLYRKALICTINTFIFFTFFTGNESLGQTVQQFSTAGTHNWTVPCGVSSIKVEAWGSGAGGSLLGGGGGGGAYSAINNYTVTAGTQFIITVGAGGAANNDGNFSSFRLNTTTLVYAEGGGMGSGNNSEGGRASAGIGTIRFSGGNGAGHTIFAGGAGGGGSAGSTGLGGNGSAGSSSAGGAGGAAGSGGGAKGGNGGHINTGSNGKPGASPGGGGGESSSIFSAHGAGASGLVKITYTVNPLTVNYGVHVIMCAQSAISPIVPVISNGTVNSFSVSPSLPASLSLNTTTGIISGTAPANLSPTVYTITAVNTCYTVPVQLTLSTTASKAGVWSDSVLSICYNGSDNLQLYLSGTVGTPQWQSANASVGPWTNMANGNFSNLTTEKFYRVIAQKETCKKDTSSIIKLGIKNMWRGGIDTQWFNKNNWSDLKLPEFSTCPTVRITAGINNPTISDTTVFLYDLEIYSGAKLRIDSGLLSISGKIQAPAQSIHALQGAVELAGPETQPLKGSWFMENKIKHLIVSRTVELSNLTEDSLLILGTLSFENNTDADLITNSRLILRSRFDATANIGALEPGNQIIGPTIVERYLSVGNLPGHHPKSWQHLSAPLTGTSIRDAWQESGFTTGTPNGYGTWITGPAGIAGGYDAYSALPSLKTYNAANSNYVAVPGTYTDIFNPGGYMIFVRGDRSVSQFSGPNSAPVPTVLRAKGEIIRGNQMSPVIPAGKFQSIANPYPSAIDFKELALDGGAVNSFTVWDPWLSGYYGLGGFQTIIPINAKYVATPGRQYRYGGDSLLNRGANDEGIIQNGQAFFMRASGSDGRVYFEEKDKVNSSSTVMRVGNITEDETDPVFGSFLYALSGTEEILADGNRVVFGAGYSNAVDFADPVKFQNEGENFGLMRQGKQLAVEFRNTITQEDTIFYHILNMRTAKYKLWFAPEYFSDPSLVGIFIDRFTGTQTAVSLQDSSHIWIEFTNQPGSKAANRFMLVFKPTGVVPVRFVSVQAQRIDEHRNRISWKVAEQQNSMGYRVERSSAGHGFTEIDFQEARMNTGPVATYSYIDSDPLAGINYYRITALEQGGAAHFSRIVSVAGSSVKPVVSLYPNPVRNGIISLRIENCKDEKIRLFVTNSNGQQVYTENLPPIASQREVHQLHMPGRLSAGLYRLHWTMEKGLGGNLEVLVSP